jgi:hypothetical protein
MPIRLRGPGIELALLSATADLGTAQLITLRDLHLEFFFPAGAATPSFFEGS